MTLLECPGQAQPTSLEFNPLCRFGEADEMNLAAAHRAIPTMRRKEDPRIQGPMTDHNQQPTYRYAAEGFPAGESRPNSFFASSVLNSRSPN